MNKSRMARFPIRAAAICCLRQPRLFAEQGERQQATDLLAPVFGGFTEGFDTPDLMEAKALLDDLHG
jgi:predicted ATPase